MTARSHTRLRRRFKRKMRAMAAQRWERLNRSEGGGRWRRHPLDAG